jgi:hypothetical protein
VAIEVEPRYPDTWKRRGQVRAVAVLRWDWYIVLFALPTCMAGTIAASGLPSDPYLQRLQLFLQVRSLHNRMLHLDVFVSIPL